MQATAAWSPSAAVSAGPGTPREHLAAAAAAAAAASVQNGMYGSPTLAGLHARRLAAQSIGASAGPVSSFASYPLPPPYGLPAQQQQQQSAFGASPSASSFAGLAAFDSAMLPAALAATPQFVTAFPGLMEATLQAAAAQAAGLSVAAAAAGASNSPLEHSDSTHSLPLDVGTSSPKAAACAYPAMRCACPKCVAAAILGDRIELASQGSAFHSPNSSVSRR
jgi:hypothetical protein